MMAKFHGGRGQICNSYVEQCVRLVTVKHDVLHGYACVLLTLQNPAFGRVRKHQSWYRLVTVAFISIVVT